MEPIIYSRIGEAKFVGEYSSLEYRITASGKIIREMDEALRKIESKYKKKWDTK